LAHPVEVVRGDRVTREPKLLAAGPDGESLPEEQPLDETSERMNAAVRRLEELLANPGPGITVRRLGDTVQAPPPVAAPPLPPQAPLSKILPVRPIPKIGGSTIADRLGNLVGGRDAPPTTIAPSHTKLKPNPGESEIRAAIRASKRAFQATGVFSLVINVLMLAGPLFMLQVYDRVMTSGSMPTLIGLALMTAALYAIIGVLELVRTRVIVRIGVEVDNRLGDRIFQASLKRSLTGQGNSLQALRELDSLRQFIAGPGPLTFFDAPWTPIYILVIFLTHWTLGIVATLGAILLMIIAWTSETSSRQPLGQAGKAAARSLELAETGQRNAEAITAMGMLGAYRARWQQANGEALAWQIVAADRLGTMSSISKALRLLLQSLMLAVGAALAIKGEISAGSIIAGTIIFGRALAPVEQAIGHWRTFVKAQESYHRLDDLLRKEPEPAPKTALPKPAGHVEVGNLRVAAPDTRQLILSNINFEVLPGQMLAVIGPSASGKSTLARALVGLWPPFGGTIKLDGAGIDQWSQEDLGQHLGYLPQDVELFAGTVKENISRFREDAADADVITAAQMAHAHEMILALPHGYDTQLGNYGTYLSAGQRQRIGLARALFGHPAMVVLDEPNSNLDRLGDEALASAIDGMRARGQAVILVSHRVQAIGKADMLLYIDRGIQKAFGPRTEVMKMFQGQSVAGAPQPKPDAPAKATAAAS
jgi:PrtD family type I secretion system ABC transporter